MLITKVIASDGLKESVYSIKNEYVEIPICTAQKINALKFPKVLEQLYKELQKKESATVDYTTCKSYFVDVLKILSDIDKDIIDNLEDSELFEFVNTHLLGLLFAIKYGDTSKVRGLQQYNDCEFPEYKQILGGVQPFSNVSTYRFCELSDINYDINNAHVLLSLMLCKNEFDVEGINHLSKKLITAPVSVYFEAIAKLYEVHIHISKIYPKLFDKSKQDTKDKSGWRGVLLDVAKTKIMDKTGLNSIEAVERSNMWDFIEVINHEKHRAVNTSH